MNDVEKMFLEIETAFNLTIENRIAQFGNICAARDTLMRAESVLGADLSSMSSEVDDQLRQFIQDSRNRMRFARERAVGEPDLLRRFEEVVGRAEAYFLTVDASIGPPPSCDVSELIG